MRWFFAVITWGTATSTIALILALTEKVLTLADCWVSILGGLVLGFLAFKKGKIQESEFATKDTVFSWFVIVCFVLFCYRQFFWLYFYKDSAIWTLDEHNFGDLPAHVGIIRMLASRGAQFWPESPFFVGESFNYSFASDLLASVYTVVGCDIGSVLTIQGFVLALAVGYGLYLWAGFFGIGAFLFSGGMAGYEIFVKKALQDYQAQLAWKNLALTLLVPQRSFLLGFPVGLFLLWAWRERFLRKSPKVPIFIEGIFWGLLPFFHIHTFIILSLFFAIWCLSAKALREGLKIFAVALPLAAPLMWLLTSGFSKASLLWIKPGWMMDSQNPFEFLFVNFGLWLPLSIWTLFLAIQKKQKEDLITLACGLGTFLVLFFVMFNPWEWDNVKLMVWAYFLLLPSIYRLVLASLKPLVRTLVLISLFFSGAICVWASYKGPQIGGYSIMSVAEIDAVCQALERVEPGARIATSQSFDHPVLVCGHKLVAGYTWNLWSHGIKKEPVEKKLAQLMNGVEGWENLAYELKAKYLYWGSREQKDFEKSTRPWEKAKTKIAEGVWGTIYEL